MRQGVLIITGCKDKLNWWMSQLRLFFFSRKLNLGVILESLALPQG